MSKPLIYLIIFLVITITISFFGFNIYNSFYGVPKDAPTGKFSFDIKEGDNLKNLAKQLEDKKIIFSSENFVWLEKTNPINDLVVGTYTLELNKDKPEVILQKIDQETKRILAEKQENKLPVIKITFREGIRADSVFQLLADNEIVNLQEIQQYATNPNNFDRQKYPFLPKILDCEYGNAKNCIKYYIEGYLYPDTYRFFKPSTVKSVIEKFLDNFKNRVWLKVNSDLNNKDFDKVVIMASVLEKETGRPKTGITEKNLEEVNQERAIMAGVFYNRLEKGMKWQSDVTVEYVSGRKLCQQTFKIENCLFLDEKDSQHLYNTYQNSGYPIGPVTSPEINNILAVLNPTSSDYLFFVSDVTGKKYFSKNEAEHEQTIKKVNEINRSLGL